MSQHPTDPTRDYATEANKLDEQLDATLREIRNRTGLGELTAIQAADLRVTALERHIEAITQLRAEYFGENGGSQ